VFGIRMLELCLDLFTTSGGATSLEVLALSTTMIILLVEIHPCDSSLYQNS
jgi:hypothetical protein